MIRIAILASVLALAVPPCGSEPQPPPQPPPGVDVILPPWDNADVCGSAAARARALGCEPVRGDSATWETVCRFDRARGLRFFNLECAMKMASRAEVSRCGITCIATQ